MENSKKNTICVWEFPISGGVEESYTYNERTIDFELDTTFYDISITQTWGASPYYIHFDLDEVLHLKDFTPHPLQRISEVIKSYSGRSSSSSIKLVVMLDLMDGNVITPPLLAQSSGESNVFRPHEMVQQFNFSHQNHSFINEQGPIHKSEWSCKHHITNSILNSAQFSGWLAIYDTYTDRWDDVLVALTENEIWIGLNSKHLQYDILPSRITLSDDVIVESIDSNTFTICKSSDVFGTFKSSSKLLCREWINTIKNQSLVKGPHDVLTELENDIRMNAEILSKEDADDLMTNMTFEGMIKNNRLRELFQTFLEKNYSEEIFKFWQYAEDFRRGHPESTDPFNFIDDADFNQTSAKNSNSRQATRAWCNRLYKAFLEEGGVQQIGDCSTEERGRIKREILSQNPGKPSCVVFAVVQQECFRACKFTWYPYFVQLPRFRSHLIAATLEPEAEKRNDTIAKYSDLCLLLQHTQSDKKKNLATKFMKTFKDNFKLGTDKKKSMVEANNLENEDSMHISSLKVVLPCPWRKAPSGHTAAVRQVTDSASFDAWLDRSWWNYVDMGQWRSLYGGGNQEKTLQHSLPVYMNADSSSTSSTINFVMNRFLIQKQAGVEADYLKRSNWPIPTVPPVCLVRSSEHDDEFLSKHYGSYPRHSYRRKWKETHAKTSVEKRKTRRVQSITLSHMHRSLYKGFMQMFGLPGDIVFFGLMSCKIKRIRSKPFPARKQSIFDPRMGNSSSSLHDAIESAKSDTSLDPLLNNKFESSVGDNIRQAYLVQHEGEGRLYIINPLNIDQSFFLRLEYVDLLRPKPNCLRTIQIVERFTINDFNIWEFSPCGINTGDTLRLTEDWINYIYPNCPLIRIAIGIRKFGYLEKEGKASDLIRTGFQKRLFILKSDCTVEYYQDRGFEKLLLNNDIKAKGIIDLVNAQDVSMVEERRSSIRRSLLASQMIEFKIVDATGRFWILTPPSNRVHEQVQIVSDWVTALCEVAFAKVPAGIESDDDVVDANYSSDAVFLEDMIESISPTFVPFQEVANSNDEEEEEKEIIIHQYDDHSEKGEEVQNVGVKTKVSKKGSFVVA